MVGYLKYGMGLDLARSDCLAVGKSLGTETWERINCVDEQRTRTDMPPNVRKIARVPVSHDVLRLRQILNNRNSCYI